MRIVYLLPIAFVSILAHRLPAIVVSNVAELAAAVSNANGGGDPHILLLDGTYALHQGLVISGNGIEIASQSGVRDAVILRGQGMRGGVPWIFLVQGSGFTLRNLTLGFVSAHAVQIQGERGASDVRLSNLRIQDTYEQMVKISHAAGSAQRSRNGILEGCLLEYTAGIGPQYYIGGIDGHHCEGWIVRDNVFRFIASPSGSVAEHAVHFWSDSAHTVVENNRIVDCDRGIGFGLGNRGHQGGTIRNNMIYHSANGAPFADVAIGLENASGVEVDNNTVFLEHAYPNAIEYRFAGTQGGVIANNLCNRAIRSRDGGSAQLMGNLTSAVASWFVAASQADLHLAGAIAGVVDHGIPLAGLERDLDGDPRPLGSGVDIGADEYVTRSAAYLLFGRGCRGSAGEPGLRALALPWLGHSLSIELGNLPAARTAFLFLGVSHTSWGAGVSLPLDLGGLGMPGCALLTSIEVVIPLVSQSGSARWSLPLPVDPALLGGRFFNQALVEDPTANPLGATVTNAGEGRIGG